MVLKTDYISVGFKLLCVLMDCGFKSNVSMAGNLLLPKLIVEIQEQFLGPISWSCFKSRLLLSKNKQDLQMVQTTSDMVFGAVTNILVNIAGNYFCAFQSLILGLI